MNGTPPNNPLDVVKGRESGIGPLVAAVIVLLLLVIGAAYLWSDEHQSRGSSATGTTTEVVIHVHRGATATGTPAVSSAASSTYDAEIDAIEQSIENQSSGSTSPGF